MKDHKYRWGKWDVGLINQAYGTKYLLTWFSDKITAFHRADFLKVLEDHIPKHYKTHFNKRVITYEDDPAGPVTIRFSDGTTTTCDVLVGADGVKSAVRKGLFESLAGREEDPAKSAFYKRCVDPRWSGLVMYRALIPTEALKKETPDHFALASPRYVSDI